MIRRPAAPRVALGLLFALCVALHAPLLGWGAPAGTTDERTYPLAADDLGPLGALAEMYNTFVASQPERNYAYPWFHYALTAGAQAPYLAWAKLTGRWSEPAATFPFGFRDPERALCDLLVAGRLLNALLSAATVLCAYGFAATLLGRRAGFATAGLVLASDVFQYYGRTGNLDGPLTFWCTLGAFLAARILRHGASRRRFAGLGVVAALALATKDQALVVFLPLGLALCVPRIAPLAAEERASRTRAVLAGLCTAVLVYLVATGVAFDPLRHVTHVRRTLFEPHTLSVMHHYYEPLPTLGERLADLGAALARLQTAPVALLMLLGAASAARRTPRDLVFLLPLPATFLLLSLPTGLTPYRYLLPLLPLLDVFAVRAVFAAARDRRRIAVALVALLALPRALWSADLAFAQATETRARAAAWFLEHAQAGDRIEFFGAPEKLPPLPASIATERIAGRRTGWQGEFGIEEAVRAHLESPAAPAFVILIPDWTSRPGMRRSQDCPAAIERALEAGTLGFRRVAAFEARTFLPRWLARPRLDHPSVSPEVRVFARAERATRSGGSP